MLSFVTTKGEFPFYLHVDFNFLILGNFDELFFDHGNGEF